MALSKIQSESINLADNFAFTGTVTGAGESNSPLVYVWADSTSTTVSDATNTKITLDNETIDSENLFSSSRFTVTSSHLGKYWVHFQYSCNFSNDGKTINPKIYKNGSIYLSNYGQVGSTYGSNQTIVATVSMVVDMGTNGDYIEFYVRHNHGDNRGTNTGGVTNASIYKILSS
tara:strand:+ start:157 stop:678 length:522 start_codon:yes stop_codon:yes gene_type:complete